MAEYLELEKVLDDSNIITVQTIEYGSIEVIPVDTITDIELSDVQPIKHGKWLSRCEGDIYAFSECSECGNTESCETPYCAQCGARMEGDIE